ncbi:MAG: GNAT family N-acetyltransferase [Aeromicrobium sp.]
MLDTTSVRALTKTDIPALRDLLDRDPYVNLLVRHRLDLTGLQERLMGERIWGYYEGDELVSACHAGANVVPVQSTPTAIEAFADQLLAEGVRPSSLVGLRSAVVPLWERVESAWGPARSIRPFQPFLVLDRPPVAEPDPRVRRVAIDEFDTLYPACVAMFTEEVGVDPEVGGASGYRARVAQLISQGWAFAIIEDGEVLFKTEVGAATAYACQLQGVWVRPDRRGEDISVRALAAVAEQVRAHVAPVVTLYVNDHNRSARRTYEGVGFVETEMFTSILL